MSGGRRSVAADEVRALLADQFPQWADLPVRAVEPPGWDNASFRVGDRLLARFPTDAAYSGQVAREQRWLPELSGHLSFDIPRPLARGLPGPGFPWPWSIYEWIDGATVASASARGDVVGRDLARFLAELHAVDAAGGPEPGPGNFHRGGSLATYDHDLRLAIADLGPTIDARAATEAWELALSSRWGRAPVFVHGDIAPSNLLVRDGRLAAVIDFGNLAVGDPACDLAIGWAWLDPAGHDALRAGVDVDDACWNRARGWALWKACIVAAGLAGTNAPEFARPLEVVERCLSRS